MSTQKLSTTIKRAGQPFVDDPVYAFPKQVSVITQGVARAFGSRLPQAVEIGHERVRLRWLSPEGIERK